MITHIEIDGFKSFQKVSLDLGALNIFVGTNASGKSNFFTGLKLRKLVIIPQLALGTTV